MNVQVSAPEGHNLGPFELIKDEIDDIYMEAENWLSGEEVTAEQEPAVNKLLVMLKDISKRERALFKENKDPHAKAAKEVDEQFNPLKKMLADAKEAAQAALTPLRMARDKIRQEEARKVQELADKKLREAQELAASTTNADLGAREIIDKAEKAAKKLTAKANAISKQSTGLRKAWVPYLNDSGAAATYYFNKQRTEFDEFLLRLATSEVRAGSREIPGFEIKQVNSAQ